MKRQIITFSHWIIVVVGIPAGLYLGRAFLPTFMIAAVLALVFGPIMDWLIGKGISKGWAVAASAFMLFLFFAIMGAIFTYQISLMADDWPRIQQRGLQMMDQLQHFITSKTGLSSDQQVSRIKQGLSNMGSTGMAIFGSFTTILTNFFLLFVYLVLLLSQRNRIMQFILKIVDKEDQQQATKTIFRVRSIASLYVWGKIQVMIALAVTYAIGFSIGGIQYSILLGIIAALFSFIPYLGNILGGGLAALFAVVSGQLSSVFVILGVMTLAQLLENYVLTPFILGDEVDLNPFFSIVSVVVFSMLWGVGGAIVAIPLTAIIKVIFTYSPFTQPAAFLMEKES